MNKSAKILALISFFLGTFLLVIYYLTMSAEFALFSYFLVGGIVVINLMVLILLISKLLNRGSEKEGILKTIGIMLLNIPIALFYFYVVSILTSYIRLTITNKTNTVLSNIVISGCDKQKIDGLNVNESETVWIKISGDCSVNLSYNVNGVEKEENVFGYVTNMMGQKVKYDIGIDKKSLDTEF
ncbi:hypothetical protein JSO62_02470 [Riemerella anatipestifer]|uniref:hypothetical protein n=1 Tax=Riemerella anatipestifer TaxID=34085 RepID=UPI0030BF8A07